MDRPDVVSGRMGGRTGGRGQVDSGRDRVRDSNARPTTLELYDIACQGRITGTIDPRLTEFASSYPEPKSAALTPEQPSDEQVGEYTLWLTVQALEKFDFVISNPSQPITLSAAVDVYRRLLRDFVTCSTEETVAALDTLQGFFVAMLRYPFMPELSIDTKECPECYFETEITMDSWEQVRRQMSCCHFTLRHEQMPLTRNEARTDNVLFHIDGNVEMTRLGPSRTMFANQGAETSADERGANPVKFVKQIAMLKRRDEIIKQKTIGKEIFHQLCLHTRTLRELETPRYLSAYPISALYRFYGSLNRSRERAQLFSDHHAHTPVANANALSTNVEDLRMNLKSISTMGNNDKLLSYVCRAMIGPLRRYDLRYRSVADRVVLFKHLIAAGFPVESASMLVKTVLSVKRSLMVDSTLDAVLEQQLRKTLDPTSYNRKVLALIWLFSHIAAYCTLHQLDHGDVRMGDSPDGMDADGIYVFDQDHVGFRVSAARPPHTDGRSATPWVSAYMPFSRVLELLALRDCAKERLC